MDRELTLDYTDEHIQALNPHFGVIFDTLEKSPVPTDARIAGLLAAQTTYSVGELIKKYSPMCASVEELETILNLMGVIVKSTFDEMWVKSIDQFMKKLKQEATHRYFFDNGLQN